MFWHHLRNLPWIIGFVLLVATMNIWTGVRDAIFPPNELYAANDNRRRIFKDTTIFKRYVARALQSILVSVLSLAIFSALSIAFRGWYTQPPPVFMPCLEEASAGPAARSTVFDEAQHHGAWCSTRDRFHALPCLCCFADGFCWHSAKVSPYSGPKMNAVDRGAPDGLARLHEWPIKVEACYYKTPKQLVADCEDETDPWRIIALYRALEMRSGDDPVGLVVND